MFLQLPVIYEDTCPRNKGGHRVPPCRLQNKWCARMSKQAYWWCWDDVTRWRVKQFCLSPRAHRIEPAAGCMVPHFIQKISTICGDSGRKDGSTAYFTSRRLYNIQYNLHLEVWFWCRMSQTPKHVLLRLNQQHEHKFYSPWKQPSEDPPESTSSALLPWSVQPRWVHQRCRFPADTATN